MLMRVLLFCHHLWVPSIGFSNLNSRPYGRGNSNTLDGILTGEFHGASVGSMCSSVLGGDYEADDRIRSLQRFGFPAEIRGGSSRLVLSDLGHNQSERN